MADPMVRSKALASLRFRLIQAKVLSATQRLGWTTNPAARLGKQYAHHRAASAARFIETHGTRDTLRSRVLGLFY